MDDGYGDYFSGEAYLDLDIDSYLVGDAYAEETADYESDEFGDEFWMDDYIYLYQNGQYLDSTSGSDDDDATAEGFFWANPGTFYEADGEYYVCSEVFDEQGNNCWDQESIYVYVDTYAASPDIDSTSPYQETGGDSGTMTIYGDNLANSDGSAPSVSWYSDTNNSYDGAMSFGSVQVDGPNQLTVPYTIGYVPADDWGAVVVTTDGGTAYSPDFEIQAGPSAPPPSISSVTPGYITAGDTGAELTITGQNLLSPDGSWPTVTTSSDYIALYAVSYADNSTIMITYDVPDDSAPADPNVYFYVSNDVGSATSPTPITLMADGAGACPQSISVNQNLTQDMPLYATDYQTGIGAVYGLNVAGSPNTNYYGSQITESVTPIANGNTCPGNFQDSSNPYTYIGNVCTGSSTFIVGQRGTSFGGIITVDPTLNIYFDQHYSYNQYNINQIDGIQECSVQCSQVYSCNGTPISIFTITMDYTESPDGTATNVTTSVQ